MASTTDFTAILAGNDLIALGALAALTEAGLRCPRDVSVVGFNDLPLVDKLTPSLTTVTLPLHAMGALAARILLDAIDGPPTTGRAQSLLGVDWPCAAAQGLAVFDARPYRSRRGNCSPADPQRLRQSRA